MSLSDYSIEEINEFVRCREDITYFAENYFTRKGDLYPDGDALPTTLYDGQRLMLSSYARNSKTICMAARQSGDTTAIAIFSLWKALFFGYNRIALVRNDTSGCRETIAAISYAATNLPVWLKPSIKSLSKGFLRFGNGCTIATANIHNAKERFCGYTADTVVWADMTLGSSDRVIETWNTLAPVIASTPQCNVVLTSTGVNAAGGSVFETVWEGAVHGTNGFVPIVVTWGMVNERDEMWKSEQIALLGEEKFNKEYGQEPII
jgi:hypothetical protein